MCAQYLGSMLIHELKGVESTKEACAKMKRSTDSMKKIPTITLSINYTGVKFIDFKSKVRRWVGEKLWQFLRQSRKKVDLECFVLTFCSMCSLVLLLILQMQSSFCCFFGVGQFSHFGKRSINFRFNGTKISTCRVNSFCLQIISDRN